MPSRAVQSAYEDFTYLQESAATNSDPSGLVALQRTYPKVLLLASASFLEVATTDAILKLWDGHPRQELKNFVKRRSLDRSYHSLFNWSEPDATQFFSFFGPDCKARFKSLKKTNKQFSDCVDAFLELGALRNNLVHRNYAEFSLDKTAEEIVALDHTATPFPQYIAGIVLET